MKNKKILITSIVVALAIVVGGAFALYSANKDSGSNIVEEGDEDINYGPPTDEEKAETDRHKEDVAKRQEMENNQADASSSGNKKQVEPIISSWDPVEKDGVNISGFVEEVYESNGTCTLTLEKDGQKVTRSQTARKDAQVTTCGEIVIPRSSLSKGTWKATLSYSSKTAKGVSQSENIDVK